GGGGRGALVEEVSAAHRVALAHPALEAEAVLEGVRVVLDDVLAQLRPVGEGDAEPAERGPLVPVQIRLEGPVARRPGHAAGDDGREADAGRDGLAARGQ